MKWKEVLKRRGKVGLYQAYDGDRRLFTIEPLPRCFYLHDLRGEYHGKPPNYIFDTLDNAKQAAKDLMEGKVVESNTRDTFSDDLNELMTKGAKLIEELKQR